MIDRSLAGAVALRPQEVAGRHRGATCQSSMTKMFLMSQNEGHVFFSSIVIGFVTRRPFLDTILYILWSFPTRSNGIHSLPLWPGRSIKRLNQGVKFRLLFVRFTYVVLSLGGEEEVDTMCHFLKVQKCAFSPSYYLDYKPHSDKCIMAFLLFPSSMNNPWAAHFAHQSISDGSDASAEMDVSRIFISSWLFLDLFSSELCFVEFFSLYHKIHYVCIFVEVSLKHIKEQFVASKGFKASTNQSMKQRYSNQELDQFILYGKIYPPHAA